jgi:hypothetical protein
MNKVKAVRVEVKIIYYVKEVGKNESDILKKVRDYNNKLLNSVNEFKHASYENTLLSFIQD